MGFKIGLLNVDWQLDSINRPMFRTDKSRDNFFDMLVTNFGGYSEAVNISVNDMINIEAVLQRDGPIDEILARNYAVVVFPSGVVRYYFARLTQDSGNQYNITLTLDDYVTNYNKMKASIPLATVNRASFSRFRQGQGSELNITENVQEQKHHAMRIPIQWRASVGNGLVGEMLDNTIWVYYFLKPNAQIGQNLQNYRVSGVDSKHIVIACPIIDQSYENFMWGITDNDWTIPNPNNTYWFWTADTVNAMMGQTNQVNVQNIIGDDFIKLAGAGQIPASASQITTSLSPYLSNIKISACPPFNTEDILDHLYLDQQIVNGTPHQVLIFNTAGYHRTTYEPITRGWRFTLSWDITQGGVYVRTETAIVDWTIEFNRTRNELVCRIDNHNRPASNRVFRFPQVSELRTTADRTLTNATFEIPQQFTINGSLTSANIVMTYAQLWQQGNIQLNVDQQRVVTSKLRGIDTFRFVLAEQGRVWVNHRGVDSIIIAGDGGLQLAQIPYGTGTLRVLSIIEQERIYTFRYLAHTNPMLYKNPKLNTADFQEYRLVNHKGEYWAFDWTKLNALDQDGLIIITMYEELTPDSTDQFIAISSNRPSIYNFNPINYNGVVSSSDTGVPVFIDALSEYFATNKNFLKQGEVERKAIQDNAKAQIDRNNFDRGNAWRNWLGQGLTTLLSLGGSEWKRQHEITANNKLLGRQAQIQVDQHRQAQAFTIDNIRHSPPNIAGTGNIVFNKVIAGLMPHIDCYEIEATFLEKWIDYFWVYGYTLERHYNLDRIDDMAYDIVGDNEYGQTLAQSYLQCDLLNAGHGLSNDEFSRLRTVLQGGVRRVIMWWEVEDDNWQGDGIGIMPLLAGGPITMEAVVKGCKKLGYCDIIGSRSRLKKKGDRKRYATN